MIANIIEWKRLEYKENILVFENISHKLFKLSV